MEKRYFGTDGVRGLTNKPPMTAETALRLGQAAGRYFRRDTGRRHSVVIGKDSKLSRLERIRSNTRSFSSARPTKPATS